MTELSTQVSVPVRGAKSGTGRSGWHLLLRWIAAPAATLLAASFLVFAALTRAPGDPVSQLLGSHATPAQVAALRHRLGLDEGLFPRYWHWLSGAVHGEFGDSITYRAPVSSLLGSRIETTLFLVLYAGLICVTLGIALGIVAALVRPAAPVIATATAIGVAIPSFVAATLLIGVFALRLGWFPSGGTGSGFSDRIWHLTLPAVALALSWGAYLTQVTRSAIREQMDREHVQTATTRGLPPIRVFRHHIMRNAASPILTVSGLTVAGLVVGAVIVEQAFGIDGIGSFLVSAIAAKDYNVVQAISLLIVTLFVVLTTLLDVAETALDPRLRGR